MSVQTSQVTSGSGDDLTLEPATGKNLKITTTLDTANPGETPLATTTADGTVKRLDVNNLDLHGPALDENDWVMVQDASDSKKIKKRKATDVGGTKQPLLPDPLPADSIWVDQTSTLAVKEGGSGSTADLRNSVEFAVIDNTFNQSDKSINPNDRIQVRWMESKMITANHGQTISGTLYAKTGSKFTQTWNLTVTKQPTAGWDLAPLIGQPVSTEIDSSLSFPSGFNAPSPVTIDGGTLTNIQVSVNGGAFTNSPGNIISGQTIQVRGTTGAADLTGYTALVSIGGIQRTWDVTTAGPTASVAQPSITSPADNATDINYNSLVVTSSAYTPLQGALGHASSDWEVYEAAPGTPKPGPTPGAGYTQVVDSPADTSNLVSYDVSSAIQKDKSYYVRVRYRSSDPVESDFSDWSTFRTAASMLPGPFVKKGGSFFRHWSVTAVENKFVVGNDMLTGPGVNSLTIEQNNGSFADISSGENGFQGGTSYDDVSYPISYMSTKTYWVTDSAGPVNNKAGGIPNLTAARDMEHANGTWILVGGSNAPNNANIKRSTVNPQSATASDWADVLSGPSVNAGMYWKVATDGSGNWLAAGGSNYAYSTNDGQTWTPNQTGAGSSSLFCCAYGNGVWVVAETGVIRWSNSLTGPWNTATVAVSLSGILMTDVKSVNGIFVATGYKSGQGVAVMSEDGKNWVDTGISSTLNMRGVGGIGSRWCCVAWGSGQGEIWVAG